MQQFLERFFEEKEIPFKQWELQDSDGRTHIIDNKIVISLVLQAPTAEQEKIGTVLSKIDLLNGDVNHFLRHLAQGYIFQNF